MVFDTEKLIDWSRQVKVKDGWVCQDCGELDRELLESHHTHPKAEYPELAFDLDNGQCTCIPCHAERHKDNPVVVSMILLRLELIIYKRFSCIEAA